MGIWQSIRVRLFGVKDPEGDIPIMRHHRFDSSGAIADDSCVPAEAETATNGKRVLCRILQTKMNIIRVLKIFIEFYSSAAETFAAHHTAKFGSVSWPNDANSIGKLPRVARSSSSVAAPPPS